MDQATPIHEASAGTQSAALHARTPGVLQHVGEPQDRVSASSHRRERRGVAETSAEAFHSLSPARYLQPKEQAVMAMFTGPDVQFTREQLAARLGWKEAAVCGRANSLVTKGCLEEIEGGKTASGRSAKLLRLPQPAQRDLIEEGTAL